MSSLSARPASHAPCIELLCPGCAEPAHDRPAVDVAGAAWSHRDGSALCPTIGATGYVPCEPVEIQPRDLTTDEVSTLDAVDFNYGPFNARDIFDVLDLITTINDATGGEMLWADVSAVWSYYRRAYREQ